jgi:copper oxidase (laccase) domain-containing protein
MNLDSITFEAPLLRGRFMVVNERPPFETLKLKQIHSDIVVDEAEYVEDISGDAIIGQNQIPKTILTADCVPIVLLSKDRHCIVHAGWRGLAQPILNNKKILEMNPLFAFIGPHIRKTSYEVTSEFLGNFPDHLHAFSTLNELIFFDMSLVVKDQLKKSFPHITIEDCELCTFKETKFHSYRRDQTNKRNWNIYIPN